MCSNLIFQKGIEKRAQPLERLKKKYAEFQTKYRSLLNGSGLFGSTNSKPVEVRGYDSKMIHEGDFCFEEIRAKLWYSKPKISKPSLTDILHPKYRLPSTISETDHLPTIQRLENYNPDGMDDDDAPGLGITVNPDDLTHINVFKDNTADLREISKLVKANNNNSKSNTSSTLKSTTQMDTSSTSTPTRKKSTTDWLLKDILMSFSPMKKKPHLDTMPPASPSTTKPLDDEENKPTSHNNSPIASGKSTNLTTNISKVSVGPSPLDLTCTDIRLLADSIPDIKTDVTVNFQPVIDYSHLMDPFDLEFRVAQSEAVLSQIASAIPNLNLRLDESAGVKVKAFEKSLGRDGSGPNHTVSSLRIASGHFFMEKKLGEGGYGKVFLAVDLMKEDEDGDEGVDEERDDAMLNDSSVNQIAIKVEAPSSVWESYIIFRIQSHLNSQPNAPSFRHFPRLISASIYSDVSFLVIDYYEQGSLLGALNVYRQQNINVEEGIVLFYASELVRCVLTLHEAGILHTDIKLENLLVLSARGAASHSTWSSNFRRDGQEGWKERGLVLIDYGRAVDLKLLKDEEESRFYIKSKHEAFNASPRIAQGLDVSHEMDWYGVADCLHWLLFQRALQTKTAATVKLSNPLKRYWQTDVWDPLFQDLLNPPRDYKTCLQTFEGHFAAISTKLEGWKKTPSLKSLLTRQEIMLYEHKGNK